MTRSIILAIEIDGSAEDTYRALTTEGGLAAFWTPDVSAKPEVGTALRFGFSEAPVDLEMTVTELAPDRVVRWACDGPWPYWAGTEIAWTILEADTGGTMVLFRHDGWSEEQPPAEFGSVALVWARVLLALEAHIRTGVAAPALS